MYEIVTSLVKCLPTMRETRVLSLDREDLLEKEMATHSSILAWKTPWMEEHSRLQSMASQRVSHWVTSLSFSWNTNLHFLLLFSLSVVRLFATPWTIDYQAPPSMGFSRQEYWSGLPFPSPKDLPNPRIEPGSPALQADALSSEPPEKPLFILYSTSNRGSGQDSVQRMSLKFHYLSY